MFEVISELISQKQKSIQLCRINFNCNQRWGMDILVIENHCWWYCHIISYENDDWSHHRYRRAKRITESKSTANQPTFRSLWIAIGCSGNEVVDLLICWSFTDWNGFANLGLPFRWRLQGSDFFFVCAIYSRMTRILFRRFYFALV